MLTNKAILKLPQQQPETMNNICISQLSSAGTTQLIQVSGIPMSVQTPMQTQTTSVMSSMPSVMTSMPVGAIAIPGGATIQAMAVQAATMAFRQAAPLMQSPIMTQVDPNSMGQQLFTQAMIPVGQNYATPFNFHIPQQDSKDGLANNIANIVTTMAQALTPSQQQTLINASLAQVQQQVQQVQQQQQQHLQQQQHQQQQHHQQQVSQSQQIHQQGQVVLASSSQPHLLTTNSKMASNATTVSTFGLGLMTQDGLTLQTPQLLLTPTSMCSTGQLPVTMAMDGSIPAAPKKKKKKKKKTKVPTSLTPSSSSIPDKLVTYKPNCGDADMEAFMAYQRLCNTHLDVKAKLHLLYNSRHSCQLCHREFKGFCRLRRHLQSHADFRPYKCENCTKRFYNVSKLKRHNLVHSGLKPYKCPLCDSSLSRREHLKRHMLTHSEERPYRCSGCDYSSRRLDGVHKHIKGKHSSEDAKVMYVRPQIFDLLSHDFTSPSKSGGEDKDSDSSPARDPLTDKDSFLQLMMGNIKFSQLFTTGTTAASNAPKPLPAENGKKKKKKNRKPSNPMKIKDKLPEETKVEPVKFGQGTSMTLPVITAPIVSIGNGMLDSQRMIFQNRSLSQTSMGESQSTLTTSSGILVQPNTPTPQSMAQGQGQQSQQNDVIYVSSHINQHMVPQQIMTIANLNNIKQENATPQPQDITSNGNNQPMPGISPIPQQFNNFNASQILPQGQQFFHAHLGDQVQVTMPNSLPVTNAASAFQSVYAGGTYEPVPAQMVPGKFYGPVTTNAMYEPDPFNGMAAGVAGIPSFFRRRIGQGCRQLNDMTTTFQVKQKQPNFTGQQ